ncbi:UNVERIFIED_CONTAM: hypothetical protein FKN15_038696 [Acipenser sinensis]
MLESVPHGDITSTFNQLGLWLCLDHHTFSNVSNSQSTFVCSHLTAELQTLSKNALCKRLFSRNSSV